jgi:hypothetical protein
MILMTKKLRLNYIFLSDLETEKFFEEECKL